MDFMVPRTTVGDTPDLELALLRRSVARLADECERCSRCRRSLLVGERVYGYAGGHLACELCRVREHAEPDEMRIVHGPAFGNTLRIVDRRPVRRAA
jgi:hypothetical protein